MECVNCGQPFKKYAKSYGRKSLFSAFQSELAENVLGSRITPKEKGDNRFVCLECEKLLKSASVGEDAKQKLFHKTAPGTYVSRKRKSTALLTPAKRLKRSPRLTSTPRHCKVYERSTTGSKYMLDYKFKAGFRWYLKRSKAATRALREILVKSIRKEVRELLKQKIPLTENISFEAFRGMNWDTIISKTQTFAPLLYHALIGAMTYSGQEKQLLRGRPTKHTEDTKVSLKPVLGSIIAQILAQVKPNKANLFQKMNSVHMWRAGSKRYLFSDFQHIGISVAEATMRKTLDTLVNTFDKGLISWKKELKKYVFKEQFDSSDGSPMSSQYSETDDQSTSTDISEISSTSDSSLDEWEDIEVIQDEASTLVYGEGTEDIPHGYTICWDNVGKQVKARHQTRNHGNKYLSWALSYVAKNRVQTTHLTDLTVIPACDIPLRNYFLTDIEIGIVREEMIKSVCEILLAHITGFRQVDINLDTTHRYTSESKMKSEICNIGVIPENPSTTAGVISILENLHKYVPVHNDGTIFPIIVWGDGLSCERHTDAQNARSNAATPVERLEGLEPSPQEFHKRMILMQETMDRMFDGRSAQDKGTLFHLKNVFNRRSVSKHVSESFNYVSEFLNFVTIGYVLLFAMDELGIESLDEELDIHDKSNEEQGKLVKTVAKNIVEKIWCGVTKFEEVGGSSDTKYDFCFCKEDMEEFDEPMIECDNNDCENGGWFHYVCVDLTEDNLPEEQWFCSSKCREFVLHYGYCICKTYKKDVPMIECSYPKCPHQWLHGSCVGLTEDQFPDEDTEWFCSPSCRRNKKGKAKKIGADIIPDMDRKFEYTKLIVWNGIQDRIRRKAVRSNHGEHMVLFWKMDMPLFFKGNHGKYLILCHRLIAALNGWLPERMRHDLVWNRTVNLNGGTGKNDEMDLVNEFLNREFKDSIKTTEGKYTPDTLSRHGKLAGGFGGIIHDVYSTLVEGREKTVHSRKEKSLEEDIKIFIDVLRNEKLTIEIPGRYHKTFPKFQSGQKVKNIQAFVEKITKLSKRLDKRRRVVVN